MVLVERGGRLAPAGAGLRHAGARRGERAGQAVAGLDGAGQRALQPGQRGAGQAGRLAGAVRSIQARGPHPGAALGRLGRGRCLVAEVMEALGQHPVTLAGGGAGHPGGDGDLLGLVGGGRQRLAGLGIGQRHPGLAAGAQRVQLVPCAGELGRGLLAGGGDLAAAPVDGGRLALQAAMLLVDRAVPVGRRAAGGLGLPVGAGGVGDPRLQVLQRLLGRLQLGAEGLGGLQRHPLGAGGLLGGAAGGQPTCLRHRAALDPAGGDQLAGGGDHAVVGEPGGQVAGLVQAGGEQDPVEQRPGHLAGSARDGDAPQQAGGLGRGRSVPPRRGAAPRSLQGVQQDRAAAGGVAERAGGLARGFPGGHHDRVRVGAERGGHGGLVARLDRQRLRQRAGQASQAGALQGGQRVAAGGARGRLERLPARLGRGALALQPALLGPQPLGLARLAVVLAARGGQRLRPGRLLPLQLRGLVAEGVELARQLGLAALQAARLAVEAAGLGLELLDGPLQAGDLRGQPDLTLVGPGAVALGAGHRLVVGCQRVAGLGAGGLGRGGGFRGRGQLDVHAAQLGQHLGGLALQVGGRAPVLLVGERLGEVAGALLGQRHGAPQALPHGVELVGGLGGARRHRLLVVQDRLQAGLLGLGGLVGGLQFGQALVEAFFFRLQHPGAPAGRGQLAGAQHQPDLTQLGLHLGGLAGGLRLLLERLELAAQLADQVGQADQVLLHAGQLAQRLLLAAPVLVDAGGLLDGGAAVLRPSLEDVFEAVLADDGVQLTADAAVGEQLLHVQQPARRAVDRVLALAGAVQQPGDGDLGEVDRQQVGAVVDGEAHLSATQRRAVGGPGEDHVLHPAATQGLRALLTEHPGDGVDHVGLAGPVGPHDHGDPGLEVEDGLVRERLEPAQGQRLEEHASGREPFDPQVISPYRS